ncbi:lipase lipD [Mycobacterium haemophilum DSM 44634]|uniref:esterase/beta-lactamase LipL n=1 Tax=Mycobacterium haemophilum TaxID=29311 RepID=UPI00065562F7|nr:serine hydrolase domain-containing protein [Mycobacterium haemophilum]AKN15853.1 esterase [Mycobacterium haemophilum DSM 44634]MCV7339238.1 beta-lactamase family protein [Mycobacterium haemophilum DSM 44634]
MTPAALLVTGDGLPRGVSGAADPHFANVVKLFAQLFPGRRLGGGALSVYIEGRPVVDVWTGWSDRAGTELWTADTGAMVFSSTKGVASTVIHRLVDRGLLSYDAPVCDYWPEFAAHGKADITIRDVLRHRSGLSHLRGVTKTELMDHLRMEQRLAAAGVDHLRGVQAYHALTYGWLLSGLARAVTGKGMRQLIREEVARPLNTDGMHLGRPPAGSPTRPAQILMPQLNLRGPVFNFIAPKVAGLPFSGALGAVYFPGVVSLIQGDTPLLDGEIPAANGVLTARALAKMYAVLADDGRIDRKRYLSKALVRGLTGESRIPWPDLNTMMPMPFHLGYHESPIPGLLKGFGHIGLGGTLGWADPATHSSFGYIHNRLVTPRLFDMGSFAGLAGPLRKAIEAARHQGPREVPQLGATYTKPARRRAASPGTAASGDA